jgi:bacterioferritin-associated ferredoxin
MIVCSCNVLSDSDIRAACKARENAPRTAGQVYGCLGCSPQCGRCVRAIKRIMDEALGVDCQVGCEVCPHSGRILKVPANANGQGQPVPVLAAAAPDRS